MSKWIDAMRTGMSVTSAAADEATRSGSPDVDIDHLFIGLVVSGGRAGTILRKHGVTLESARDAIATVRERELGSLGITAPPLEPLPKLPLEKVQLDWSHRANAALSASRGEHDGTAFLGSLLDEPSGMIERILSELNVEAAALRADIANTSGGVPKAAWPDEHRGRHLHGTAEAFVPAAPADVWALVSDPKRSAEWDDSITALCEISPGLWHVTLRAFSLRGREVPDRSEAHIRRVVADSERWHVGYERTWPKHPRAADQLITIELTESGPGTLVTLHSSLQRASGARRVMQLAISPLPRVMLNTQATQFVTGISRVFR